MLYVTHTRWLWPLLVLVSCADDGSEGDLQQQEDRSIIRSWDAGASADSALPDAGEVQQATVPPIMLERYGLPSCIEPGMVRHAEITTNPDTGRVSLLSGYCS